MDGHYIIPKVAKDMNYLKNYVLEYSSAREAMKDFIRSLDIKPNETILLPSYIGWSSREGSGVFDPILELGINYKFYSLDRNLNIRVEELINNIKDDIKIIVLIHYFGRPDPNYRRIVDISKSKGIVVIEDAAHALFTSWFSNERNISDATIYSLHKMLPIREGGLLKINNMNLVEQINRPKNQPMTNDYLSVGLQYNFYELSRIRQQNYKVLQELIRPLADDVRMLWSSIDLFTIVPQTFPILILSTSRDEMYHKLNDLGFGVVSLYHTMIRQIDNYKYPDAYWVSQRIMNLPVHQECSVEQLIKMVDSIKKILK